jgi:predicted RNA-binding protein YlqC (UPF0109 family)
MLKELVEYIIKELVTQPQAVSIKVDDTSDPSSIIIKIYIDDVDRGRVIGKEGKTIKAIRTLVNVVSSENKRVTVEVAQ